MSIFDFSDDYKPPPVTKEIILLFRASSSGNMKRVQELLLSSPENMPSPYELVNGFNSLHISSKKGFKEIVSFLLYQFPLLLNTTTSDGRTALMLAAYEQKLEVLKILRNIILSSNTTNNNNESVPDPVDGKGNAAIHYAAWGGSLECTKYLVEDCQMNPLIKNTEGVTPIHFAVAGNFVDIVAYLSKFSVASTDGFSESSEGFNALHRAAMYGSLNSLQLLLQDCELAVDGVTSNGSTALHLSCQHGHLEVVQFLVMNYNADINAANSYGLTPLMFACLGGFVDICEFLLSHGARADISNASGGTALHMAASKGHIYSCKLLAKQGNNVDLFAVDEEGYTAIDAALNNGYKEVAKHIAYLSSIQLHTQNLLSRMALT